MRNSRIISLVSFFFAVAGMVCAEEEGSDSKQARNVKITRMFEESDKDRDGFLDRSELPERMRTRFEQMDANQDGKLALSELTRFAGRGPNDAQKRQNSATADPLLRYLDASGDGELSADEIAGAIELLRKLDKNDDGAIDRGELGVLMRSGSGGRPGEIITPAAKGERIAEKLKVGDVAPDFTLPLLSGQAKITLSGFQGQKPVVLIFASYT